MSDPIWRVKLEGEIDDVAVELTAGIQAANAEKAGRIAARLLSESEVSNVRVCDVSPAGQVGVGSPRRRRAGGDDPRRQGPGGDTRRQKGGGE